MTRPSLFLCAAGGLLALAACATPPQPAADGTVLAAAEDEEKLICKERKQIGSIIPRRLCMTQEDWDDVRGLSQEQTGEVQRRSLTSCAIDNCNGG